MIRSFFPITILSLLLFSLLSLRADSLPNLPDVIDKAVYYDDSHNLPSGWIFPTISTQIKDYFTQNGYVQVNAQSLALFMQSHLNSRIPSAVVSATDVFPDTVVDLSSGAVVSKNLITDYLNAGGRIVQYGDIPFWQIANGASSFPSNLEGAEKILGFKSTDESLWDSKETTVLTSTAIDLGLTATWASLRPANLLEVDVVLSTANGGAASWMRFYPSMTAKNPGIFIRLADRTLSESDDPPSFGQALLSDTKLLAEFTNPSYGDIDENGTVTIADVVLLLRFYFNLISLTDEQIRLADVRPKPGIENQAFGDGKINSDDINWLLRRVTQLETAQ